MRIGDIVLVRIDATIYRPMTVGVVLRVPSAPVDTWRVSGLLVCEPDDQNTPGLRNAFDQTGDPGRIHGLPNRFTPYAYGECLAQGPQIGQWQPKEPR